MYKKTNSINNNLNINSSNNLRANNNNINTNNSWNNKNNIIDKQMDEKSHASNKNTTKENFYNKEVRDNDSHYLNKDYENPLRKSTDFYFLPKIKYQFKNENSLMNLNNKNNSNGRSNNLFKNKTVIINYPNTNFGYLKDETTYNNIFDNNYNTNNNLNTHSTNTINTTDSQNNTFFSNPKLMQCTSSKNYNFIDESYNYRFKASPTKSLITTNFKNTTNNLNANINNQNSSMSVSQKQLDFKSIIENEKYEKKRRLQQFFNNLNMSSINFNFPSAKNLNMNNLINNNNNNLNSIIINPHFSKSNNNLNKSNIFRENNNNNDLNKNNINNKKSNSEEKTDYDNKIQLNKEIAKNSSSNSLLQRKEHKNRMTESSFNFSKHLYNFTSFAPKNNFDAIRPLMTKSTENVLNSVDTIKNRNKIKIINKKLQISKEVPINSYMITNIKPPCLFDFNNKLKGKVLMKKEVELQKMRHLKNNPEAYYEDEEKESSNGNESEKDKKAEGSLFNKVINNSYKEIKSELENQNSFTGNNNIAKNNDINNKKNNNEENNINNNNYKNNSNYEKGIILNHLQKKETKSATSNLNVIIPQQQLASADNSLTLRNSDKNHFLNQNLNDISENGAVWDLNSSKDESTGGLKTEYQMKFESQEKLRQQPSKKNTILESGSDYFYEKEEKSNFAANSPRKNYMEKNSFGPFYMRRLTEKDFSDQESNEESVGSINENDIHGLDDSGILQIKLQESLYDKAQRKLTKANVNLKKVASMLSVKSASPSPSPKRHKVSDNTEVPPVIQLNPVSSDKIVSNDSNKFINNTNKNISGTDFFIKLYNDETSSPLKTPDTNKPHGFSSRNINTNKSYVVNNINHTSDNDINNIDLLDLAKHDFDPHEVEPNIKTKTEIGKIKNKINDLKKKRYDFKNEYLNDVHKRLEKKAFEINPDYQSTKDIYLKYRQEKVLQKPDFSIASRLYLHNRNPIFQINNMISFPLMIDDPAFLANIYNVNMYKIETAVKNKIN